MNSSSILIHIHIKFFLFQSRKFKNYFSPNFLIFHDFFWPTWYKLNSFNFFYTSSHILISWFIARDSSVVETWYSRMYRGHKTWFFEISKSTILTISRPFNFCRRTSFQNSNKCNFQPFYSILKISIRPWTMVSNYFFLNKSAIAQSATYSVVTP